MSFLQAIFKKICVFTKSFCTQEWAWYKLSYPGRLCFEEGVCKSEGHVISRGAPQLRFHLCGVCRSLSLCICTGTPPSFTLWCDRVCLVTVFVYIYQINDRVPNIFCIF